jgi:hypothetical protein
MVLFLLHLFSYHCSYEEALDVVPCCLVEVHQHFRGSYLHPSLGQRVSQASKQQEETRAALTDFYHTTQCNIQKTVLSLVSTLIT